MNEARATAFVAEALDPFDDRDRIAAVMTSIIVEQCGIAERAAKLRDIRADLAAYLADNPDWKDGLIANMGAQIEPCARSYQQACEAAERALDVVLGLRP